MATEKRSMMDALKKYTEKAIFVTISASPLIAFDVKSLLNRRVVDKSSRKVVEEVHD